MPEYEQVGDPEPAALLGSARVDAIAKSVTGVTTGRVVDEHIRKFGHYSPAGTRCKLCGKEHKL